VRPEDARQESKRPAMLVSVPVVATIRVRMTMLGVIFGNLRCLGGVLVK
jgi:hypothetical protein